MHEHQRKTDAVSAQNLSIGYGDRIVLKDLDFFVESGEIVTILGGSGCGKSTLLKAVIGLLKPVSGKIRFQGRQLTGPESSGNLEWARRRMGVLFQSGALIGSMTIAENVALPILEFTGLPRKLVDDIVQIKLEMVRLGPFGHYYPSELSGGMRKRAGLARAMALDPSVLFCDEPSAGLDPVTSAELDELLIELNKALGVTMIVITHELASIRSISRRCIMLDREERGIIAVGTPRELQEDHPDPRVRAFFNRETRSEAGIDNSR